jgi:NADPH-dependent 2,4-dienoyl-CoA reductase/sulfur reductase-like enzyme
VGSDGVLDGPRRLNDLGRVDLDQISPRAHLLTEGLVFFSLMRRVVILGGGFGGLYAAKALGRAPIDLTVVDRRNFHLFQPLLYQVATGSLSPGEICTPIRAILRQYPPEKW